MTGWHPGGLGMGELFPVAPISQGWEDVTVADFRWTIPQGRLPLKKSSLFAEEIELFLVYLDKGLGRS
ncbi:hypothetical protein JTE90_021063 [Oedothorax gibbosus]|uniref:Uncharacterized protein n=1 Tax=Oedothorax gibbosus TaxID=931172 RepID=A0AAV6VTH3_9ARAC|nr:hypothetical protein JTE90_021063 [Oedothorax gibbosus]